VRFILYKVPDGSVLETTCTTVGVQKLSEEVGINNATGNASTVTGYSTTEPGTYAWVVQYLHNSDTYNLDAATKCGAEVTRIQVP